MVYGDIARSTMLSNRNKDKLDKVTKGAKKLTNKEREREKHLKSQTNNIQKTDRKSGIEHNYNSLIRKDDIYSKTKK